MKKLTAVFCLFALLLMLAGCSAAGAVQKLDAAEEKLEDSLRKSVSPAPAARQPAATEPRPAPAESLPVATESRPMLSESEAQKIALDYLGLSDDQVTGLRMEFEVDDGVPQYDVEFHQGDWEYEFEIHAENGRIISYDKDHKYD